ncbi:MAG: hypothetical protein HS108_02885 [Planctomycetes bacterium]|nr:hypothetical protein [Planctomycetota bacterium]MCL4730979.1 hypothetical protein [Planctomycetota bacterium]
MAQAPEQPELPPQWKLLARLRLQRTVFGVLAAVLVTGAALGLAGYRRMQTQVRQADRDADTARVEQAEIARSLDRSRAETARARAELEAQSRALGLACARLAVAEARAGYPDRAQALVQDSLRHGAPPWWPVAAASAREPVLRLRGSLHPDAPAACGGVTPDGARLVVARNVPGTCVVEFYDGMDGSLVASGSPVLGPGPLVPAAEALLVEPAGRLAVLAAQGRVFAVEESGGMLRFVEIAAAGARVQHLAAAPDWRRLLVCRGRDGLTMLTRTAAGWNETTVSLPRGEARAACFGAGGDLYVADSRALYRARDDQPLVELAALAFEPETVRLGQTGGGVALAARSTLELEYFVLETPGDRVRQRTRRELPARADGVLQLLSDGTALTGVGGGRVLEFGPGRTGERSLGGYGPLFAAWHPLGLVFGNGRGEVGLRARDGAAPGMPLAALPPQLEAEAQPFGFVLTGPEGDRAAYLPGRGHLPLAGATRVYLAGTQVAVTTGEQSGVAGGDTFAPGVLLGAGAGGMLLWREGGKLAAVRDGSTTELRTGHSAPPDDTVVAALFGAALLRWQDAVYRTDLRGDPQRLSPRAGAAVDLMALSADGQSSAVGWGTLVAVRGPDGAERTVLTAAAPAGIALLYGGTVLASAEPDALVLYEVDGGRELARFTGRVTSLAATPENELLLACDGSLRRLSFR